MPDTQQVAVYVDAATGLVSKYELIFVDPLTGEEASEIMFGDYTSAGKYRVPQTWSNRQAGDVSSRFKLKVDINPEITDQSFEVAAEGYARVEPLPNNLEEQVEKLADGVFVIQNVAGQNQNTLAVEFKDYIVAVEAPGSSEGADKVIARIKEAIPGKPIRYVAMTHHHGDHIGGLRSFIAEGATVITTQTNRKVVEAMAAAPQIDRLAKNPRTPEFLFIERGKRVLKDGSRDARVDRHRTQSAREGDGDRLAAATAPRVPGRPVLRIDQQGAAGTPAGGYGQLRSAHEGIAPEPGPHRERARAHGDDGRVRRGDEGCDEGSDVTVGD